MKAQPAIFLSWVRVYGVRRLATELRVDMSTIRKWRQGHCPKPQHMRKIRTLSGGRVTCDVIVDEILGGTR